MRIFVAYRYLFNKFQSLAQLNFYVRTDIKYIIIFYYNSIPLDDKKTWYLVKSTKCV